MIEKLFFYQETADDDAYVYSAYSWPWRDRSQGGGIYNAATGVTLTAAVSTRGAFAQLAAGDIVKLKQAGADYAATINRIAAKNSDTEIELASAVSFPEASAVTAWWSSLRSRGTTATSGFHSVANWYSKAIKFDITTLPPGATVAGFGVSIEGRYSDDTVPVIYYQREYTATTDFPQIIQVEAPFTSLRVGLKFLSDGASGGEVTISLLGDGPEKW